jgi:RNA polymerase sigma factor (sigma-70 family)
VYAQARQLRERPAELLRSLSSYVSFELGRRVNLGQLDYEDLLRDEVIDSAFAAALTRLDQGEPIRDLNSYLRTRAQDMIGREVRRIQQERRQHVSLEQTLAAASDDGEGGEEVRVADIIPDPNAREPEQVVIDNESLAFTIAVLADVPDLWRTVFLQRTMQERSARDVAEREGLDIDEVRRITILTRDYLRERFEQEYEIDDE